MHFAHLAIAEEVYHALHLTKVLFVPAGHPPHKQHEPITAVEHRLAMLKSALAENPHFALSLVDIQPYSYPRITATHQPPRGQSP